MRGFRIYAQGLSALFSSRFAAEGWCPVACPVRSSQVRGYPRWNAGFAAYLRGTHPVLQGAQWPSVRWTASLPCPFLDGRVAWVPRQWLGAESRSVEPKMAACTALLPGV